MVRGMWYAPASRSFGCDGHDKCYAKCLKGKGSATKRFPHCGAFNPPPKWAKVFRCPRFVYKRVNGEWQCISDVLGLIAPIAGE